MQDYPLLVRHIAERAATVFPGREIVSQTKDDVERSTYGQVVDRARRIVAAAAGISTEDAAQAFDAAGRDVKTAIVMLRSGASREEAQERLRAASGRIREALS